MKHSADSAETEKALFGALLPLAEKYAQWLSGPAIERGLLGPRETDRIWDRHLVNCALLEPLVPSSGVTCDLGSGAGLPGIVLAIQRPQLPIVLLEPLLRRATFLSEVTHDLGLDNVTVIRERAEDHISPDGGYSSVVARAVAPLVKLVPWALPLVAAGCPVLAMKGESAWTEVSQAREELPKKWMSQIAEWEVLRVGKSDSVSTVVRIVRGS